MLSCILTTVSSAGRSRPLLVHSQNDATHSLSQVGATLAAGLLMICRQKQGPCSAQPHCGPQSRESPVQLSNTHHNANASGNLCKHLLGMCFQSDVTRHDFICKHERQHVRVWVFLGNEGRGGRGGRGLPHHINTVERYAESW